jgi:hemerythrin
MELENGVAWNDNFLLGNELVDVQHKKLFELVNNLVSACEEGRATAKLQETLDFLVNYAVQHFIAEEALQLEYAYPGYKEHKQMHEKFKGTVGELVQRFKESGSCSVLSRDINKIVVRWLVNHIMQEDKKIGKHIQDVAKNKGNN